MAGTVPEDKEGTSPPGLSTGKYKVLKSTILSEWGPNVMAVDTDRPRYPITWSRYHKWMAWDCVGRKVEDQPTSG